MKTLLLARHAKSDWVNPRLDDHDRPLAARGERDVEAMSARLVQEGVHVDRIVTSSAARAVATAEVYARALGVAADAVVVDESLYGAPSERILQVAAAQPDAVGAVMIVGHNPGMSVAVDQLTGEWLDLPTCAVAACTVESWAEVDEGAGSLVRIRTPHD